MSEQVQTYKCNACGQNAYLVIPPAYNWKCQCGQINWLGEKLPSDSKGSILLEAEQLINGPRRAAYGPVEESFNKVAQVWSVVLNHKVSAREVALCMAGLKLCREANSHSRDNLVDGAAYFGLAQQVLDASGEQP